MLKTTRFLTCLMTLFVLATCALAAENKPQEDREGGIVGTGIVGTITELGSIYVNGQHVIFPADMIVASPLGIKPAAALGVGETVVVEATFADGSWNADYISQYLPVIGPVSAAGADGFSVLGSEILIDSDTAFDGVADAAALGQGDWVAINGLWRGNTVVASLVIKIDRQDEAVIVGSYRSDGTQGPAYVGGTQIIGMTPRHAQPDDVLTVRGVPAQNGIEALNVALGLFTRPVADILMEGYLSQPGPQGLYTIYGSGVIAYAGDEPMAVFSGRGLYCAQSVERQPIVPLAELPEDEQDRMQLLESLGREAAERCGG
ncbi:DUF5666 domain-containing protein [Hoeflea sp. TYP-13]|uniref:DUF5666 domain-containing protein n=1 Tax=Hoeflea sp. TYP-13 TaxID=3230023 RepID=UPI0034C62AA9